MLFKRILITASLVSPSLNRFNVSRLNDEKVVKLPRIPIKMKVLVFDEIFNVSNKPHNKPMKNDPNRLTASVPTGNVLSVNL